MNIVLTAVHIRRSPDAIPLAPALLKTSLKDSCVKDHVNVDCIDCTVELSPEKFVDRILSYNPNVVGLSIYLWNREFYHTVIDLIKERNREIIIIAGGAEMRSNYHDFIQRGVNYTLQGEGELLIVELISALLNNKNPQIFPGINDDINSIVPDLSTLKSPLLTNNIDLNLYDGYLWELSRGCPYSCDFCFESRGSRGVRYYPFERVEAELDILIKSNIDQVFVLDPTFNKDLKRAKKILKLIKRKQTNIHFHFEVRAELLDDEIAKLFAEIGASLQIGIQSAHDDILQHINRRLNREKFRDKISLLNRFGVVFGLDLIYGLPYDSYDGFKKSMEYVLSLQPNHLDIFPLAVLPGTKLWDNSKTFHLDFSPTPPYIVKSSPTFSKEDMSKADQLKEACDFIYNKCKSTGWLLQVVKELKTDSISFIVNYIEWSSHSVNKLTGIDRVKTYIKERYNTKQIRLISDMINYHNAYSKALLSEKKVTNIKTKDLKRAKVQLSPTTTMLNFSYPLLDAFDNGIYTIDLIKQYYPKESNKVICWYHLGGEVIFETYTKDIMDFIFKISNNQTVIDIDPKIDNNFLVFAQESGLLLFSV